MQDFVCALQGWSLCFHQSCASPIIKSHWPSRSDSLGIPSPFVRAPGWEASRGAQNLHNSGKTSLVLLFSGLWVTHLAGMGFDFIVIVLLLLSRGFLSLDMGDFFWWFPCPPVNDCSTTSYDSGPLKGGDEFTSFYFAILNQKPTFFSISLFLEEPLTSSHICAWHP